MTCDCVTNTFSPKLSRSRYCHQNSAERKFCDVIMYNIAKSQDISPEVNKICARHQLCKKTPDPSPNHKKTLHIPKLPWPIQKNKTNTKKHKCQQKHEISAKSKTKPKKHTKV